MPCEAIFKAQRSGKVPATASNTGQAQALCKCSPDSVRPSASCKLVVLNQTRIQKWFKALTKACDARPRNPI
eukprot:2997309-Pleurochrysis_carterae.AAC.1